jgi:hypothetical protein
MILLLLNVAFVFVVLLFLLAACLVPVALVVCVAWDELIMYLRRLAEDTYNPGAEVAELERLYALEKKAIGGGSSRGHGR